MKHHTIKMYLGSGGTDPRILNYMEVSGQLHAPAAISTGKEPPLCIG